MSILTVLMLVVLVGFISPVAQLLTLQVRRAQGRRRLGRTRSSQVVDVVYRMETLAFFGVPAVRYVSLPLTGEVLRSLGETPATVPLDLLVHLPPGVIIGAEAIAGAMLAHAGRVTLVVPRQAFSGGLLLALAADEVLMAEEAQVGAIETQVEGRAAAQVLLDRLHSSRVPLDLGMPMAPSWQRDQPLSAADLQGLGLRVSTELPDEWRHHLALFRQPEPGHTWPVLVQLPSSARRR
jgi:Serine dehydrogenase proteinase